MKPTLRQKILEAMLDELRSFRLEVIKVPSRDGGYVRLVICANCEWYREFCNNYTKFRRGRDRTYIKRCHTIAALQRMINGDVTSTYAQRLEQVVYDNMIYYINMMRRERRRQKREKKNRVIEELAPF